MANFKPGSRYTNGVFTLNNQDQEFLTLRQNLIISESGQDLFFTVEGRHIQRPDLIAHEAYGRTELWWVIADINDIRQPIFDLVIGQELRIPPLTLVLDAIERLNQER